jgi:hypothetical protein
MCDFGKYMKPTDANYTINFGQIVGMWRGDSESQSKSGDKASKGEESQGPEKKLVLFELQLAEELGVIYGAPKNIFVEFDFSKAFEKKAQSDANFGKKPGDPDSSATGFVEEVSFDIRLRWLDKTPTRLPEAVWMMFGVSGENSVENMHNKPDPKTTLTYEISKLDSMIDATAVAVNGSTHEHSSWAAEGKPNMVVKEMSTSESQNSDWEKPKPIVTTTSTFSLTSPDTGLFSFPNNDNRLPNAYPTPFFRGTKDVNFNQIGVNLLNNLWNTAFPLWYPFGAAEDFKLQKRLAKSGFRFEVNLKRDVKEVGVNGVGVDEVEEMEIIV